jgi:polysaccharide pyruvyl transferase WcaK-like protein
MSKKPNGKPVTVCLWGSWYGSKNIGDHTLLMSITRLIRQRDADANIIVLSENARYIEEYMREVNMEVKALNKWRQFPRTLAALMRADLLGITGGVPFFDEWSHILVFFFLVALSKLFGTRVTTFGPSSMELKNPYSRLMYKLILNMMNLIAIREEWSLKHLKGLGIKKEIFLTIDPGIALAKAPQSRVVEILREQDIPCDDRRPFIGIVVRKLVAQHKERSAHYRQMSQFDIDALEASIASAADFLSQKGRVVFIPMNTQGFDDDRESIKKIMGRMKNKHDVHCIMDKYNPLETMGLINNCAFMLVNRFHSLILSFACNVPFVSVAYDVKFHGICDRLKVPEHNYDLIGLESDTLLHGIKQAWEDRQQIKAVLSKQLDTLSNVLQVNFDAAIDLCRHKALDHEKISPFMH